MSDAKVRGRILWHELNTTDQKAAAAFYLKAVGWTTQAWDENPSYVMFAAGGRPMAGLLALGADAGGRPNWLTYIGTPDLESTVRQAQALGAKILKPAEGVPAVGTWVVLRDPQGAVFAVLQPSQSPSDAEPGLGDFSWHELATTDAAAAFKFYQQLFGWEQTGGMDMGPDLGMYHMVREGRPADGRNLQEAQRSEGSCPHAGAVALAAVRARDRHAEGRRRDEEGGGPGVQRADGSAWRRLDRRRHRPAGRRVRGALAQGGSAGGVHVGQVSRREEERGKKKVARKAAAKTAMKASRKSSGKAAKKIAKKAAKQAVKKVAKKAAKKAAGKSAKKSVRRTIKKTAKRSSKTRAAKKR